MPISRDRLAQIRKGLVDHKGSMSDADWKRFDAITPEQAHQNALDDPDAQPSTDEQLHHARMNRRERLGTPLDAPDFDVRTLMKPPYSLSIEDAMQVAMSPDFDIEDVPVGGQAAKRPEHLEPVASVEPRKITSEG